MSDELKQREDKLKAQRDQELEDLKQLLDNPAGLRFIRRLMEAGRVFSSSMTANSWTYFNEGARNLALMFFKDVVEVAPHRVAELVREKIEENHV